MCIDDLKKAYDKSTLTQKPNSPFPSSADNEFCLAAHAAMPTILKALASLELMVGLKDGLCVERDAEIVSEARNILWGLKGVDVSKPFIAEVFGYSEHDERELLGDFVVVGYKEWITEEDDVLIHVDSVSDVIGRHYDDPFYYVITRFEPVRNLTSDDNMDRNFTIPTVAG